MAVTPSAPATSRNSLPDVVPHAGAGTAHQGQREPPVRGHHGGLVQRHGAAPRRRPASGSASGTIIVPTPSGVNSSSTSECSTRPSTRWARRTPARRARTALSSLGIMPPPTTAGCDSSSSVCAADSSLSRSPVGPDQAGHVVDEDQLLGAERDREFARHHVGVHVVGLSRGLVDRDARHHRHEPLGGERAQHGGVDVDHLAHEPEVGRALFASQQQPAVHPGQAHRRHAAGDERGHHLGVELAGQDHRGDVERLGVGDADPVDERGLDPEPLGHLGHLRAAAVHDDRRDPGALQQGDVLGEGGGQADGVHGRTAVFHDDHLAVVLAHERQRLEQRAGLRHGALADLRRQIERLAGHLPCDLAVV